MLAADVIDKIEGHVNEKKLPGAQPLVLHVKQAKKQPLVAQTPGQPRESGVQLNPHHSHFFLIDGEKRFGEEIQARGSFEECVLKSIKSQKQSNDSSKKHKKSNPTTAKNTKTETSQPMGVDEQEWEDAWDGRKNEWDSLKNAEEWMKDRQIKPPEPEALNSLDFFDDKVPIVCICVQGGPGTAQTVETALKTGIPVLLIKGSGGRGASDLIADLNKLAIGARGTQTQDSGQVGNEPEEKLLDFLEFLEYLAQKEQRPGLKEENSSASEKKGQLEDQEEKTGKKWNTNLDERSKAGKEGLKAKDSSVSSLNKESSFSLETFEEYKDPRNVNERLNSRSVKEGLKAEDSSPKKENSSSPEKSQCLLLKTFEKHIEEEYKAAKVNWEGNNKVADTAYTEDQFWVKKFGEFGPEGCRKDWKDILPVFPSSLSCSLLDRKLFFAKFFCVLTEYWDNSRQLQAVRAFKTALSIADNKQIRSLDLRTAEDKDELSAAVLQCLLNSVEIEQKQKQREPEKEEDQKVEKHTQKQDQTGADEFYKKLLWSIEWNDLKVLKEVVQNTTLRRDQPVFGSPMAHALHRALKLRRPLLVDFLVNNGAEEDWYKVDRDDLYQDSSPAVEAIKEIHQKEEGPVDGMVQRSYDEVWEDLLMLLPDPVVHGTDFAEKRWEHRRACNVLKVLLSQQNCDARIADLNAEARKNRKDLVKSYEEFLSEMVGEVFQYEMGKIAPEFDLMVWSVLMNKRSLAYVWFKEYMYPIRSCLTVCGILRAFYAKRSIPYSEREGMRETAEFFEQIAIALQTEARNMNYNLMLMTLETPLKMWRGMTNVDIAIYSKCNDFVEACCREAIERRFSGDLLPFSQRYPLFQSFTGLKINVILNIVFFLGFFAPFSMKYHNYPLAENLRFPTQRARMPLGMRKQYAARVRRVYGVEVLKEVPMEQLKGRSLRDTWQRITRCLGGGPRKTNRVHFLEQPEREREEGSHKIGYRHAFNLFWQAPVTLFIADSMTLCVLVFLFTWFVFTASDDSYATPFERSYAMSPENDTTDKFIMAKNWPVFPFEIALAIWFAVKAIAELLEFSVSQHWRTYVLNFWNFIDCCSVLFFFTGFYMRFYCSQNPEQCIESRHMWENSVPVHRLWVFFYSLCLFLLWARVLRILTVSSGMGPLVVLIIQMGRDIMRFGLIWIVLLFGFSCLLRGTTVSNLQKECKTNGPSEEVPFSACWTSWWVVRTFLQAFGAEIFLTEMQTDAAMIVLLLLWVIMNVLLLNLLIAIMSNTYTEMQAKAEQQYLVDMHSLVNEYSRRFLVAPCPFNLLFLIKETIFFFFRWTKVQKVYNTDRGEKMPLSAQFDHHLRRNRQLSEAYRRKLHQESLEPMAENKKPAGKKKASANKKGQEENVLFDTDMELEFCWGKKLDAFMERAREQLFNSPSLNEILAKWNVEVNSDLKKDEGFRGGGAGENATLSTLSGRGAPAPAGAGAGAAVHIAKGVPSHNKSD